MTTTNKPKSINDIYQDITNRIIASLEEGTGPWVKPWKATGAGICMHRNALTDRPYRGVNVLLLNLAAFEKGYQDPRWVTYNGARKLGGHVKKGERSTPIVFWKFLEVQEDDDTGPGSTCDGSDENKKVIPLLRLYSVFNVEQCNDLDLETIETPENFTPGGINGDGEKILGVAEIRYGGSRAVYYPNHDFIQLPLPDAFETMDHFYCTAFHEISHWSGHGSRLARKFGSRFGDQNYAFEELVAEIGSAFLGGHVGLPFKEMQHPEYIQSWIKVLREDNRAIFTACKHAQESADFITDLAFEKKDQSQDIRIQGMK